MRRNGNSNGLIAGDRYRDASDAYDVVRRGNDLQAAEGSGLADRPPALMAHGDTWLRWAQAFAVATILLVVSYCAVQTVISRRRARVRTAREDAGLVPDVFEGRPGLLKVIVFVAWLLVILAPAGQIVASLNEQRHQAMAARAAAGLSGDIAVSQAVRAFRTNSLLSGVQVTSSGLSREYQVLMPGVDQRIVDEQTTIAKADQSMMPVLEELTAPDRGDRSHHRRHADLRLGARATDRSALIPLSSSPFRRFP
jgi:hypothetical protein